jgi:Ser/Thr protein kinase RdoA (MazF antagonist)
MTVLPPPFSIEQAEALVRDRWGIAARAEVLRGERDRNFRLYGANGRQFVLKIANPAEDTGFRALQVAALRHIARLAPELPIPRVIPLPDGSVEISVRHPSGDVQHARLLSWVGGTITQESRSSIAQSVALGAMLARLQLALEDFLHPEAGHEIPWDLQHAPRLREIAFAIPYAEARNALLALLEEYDECVAPQLLSLRRQVVHNDLTRMNTLVDPADHDRVVGVIDFGDLAETAIVFDVAIGAISQAGSGADNDALIGHFVRGFHAVRPLFPEEVALLPLMMATRVAMTIALPCWHRHSQPGNPHYLRSRQWIFDRIALIKEVRLPAMATTLRQVTGLAEPSA